MKFFGWPARKRYHFLFLILLTFSLSACSLFSTPLNPEGSPNFAPGSPAGYWLWYDNDGWHLRTTTAVIPSRFTGTIGIEEGQITDVKLYQADKNQSAQLVKPNLLKVDFYTQGNVRGVDFKAPANCLTCDLKVDDKYYKKLIVVGKTEGTPSAVPFVVCLPTKGKVPPRKETKPRPVEAAKEEPAKKEEPVKPAETAPAIKEPLAKKEEPVKKEESAKTAETTPAVKEPLAKPEELVKKEEPIKKEEPAKKEEIAKKEEPSKKEEIAKKEEPVKKEEPIKKEEPQGKAPLPKESPRQTMVTEGKPRFGPGSEAKYWIWHDLTGWHLRTTTAGKVREFLGQIQAAEGTLENITPTRPQDPEFKVRQSPSGFEFIYKSVGAVEGFDWQSKSPCLEFQLSLDGKSDPKSVRVGMMGQEPTAVPFTLCGQKPIIKISGKPKVGELAMGILLWQDVDGWHIRTTTTSAGYKIDGTVTHPGGGRGAVTATRAVRSNLVLSGDDSFSFSFKADSKEEGFDWKPQNPCATFDLKFGGEHRPQLVIIGSESHSPETIPFLLCQ